MQAPQQPPPGLKLRSLSLLAGDYSLYHRSTDLEGQQGQEATSVAVGGILGRGAALLQGGALTRLAFTPAGVHNMSNPPAGAHSTGGMPSSVHGTSSTQNGTVAQIMAVHKAVAGSSSAPSSDAGSAAAALTGTETGGADGSERARIGTGGGCGDAGAKAGCDGCPGRAGAGKGGFAGEAASGSKTEVDAATRLRATAAAAEGAILMGACSATLQVRNSGLLGVLRCCCEMQ